MAEVQRSDVSLVRFSENLFYVLIKRGGKNCRKVFGEEATGVCESDSGSKPAPIRADRQPPGLFYTSLSLSLSSIGDDR